MKELENIKPDKTDIVDQREIKKEAKFLGSMRIHKGHVIWELDMGTGNIIEATYDSINFDIRADKTRKKLILKDTCLYASALNKTNAERKFKKMIMGKKK